MANLSLILSMIYIGYFFNKGLISWRLATLTFIIGGISGICFILSEIEASRLAKDKQPSDPNKGISPDILTSSENPKTPPEVIKGRQTMYLVYHTMWHILSGVCIMLYAIKGGFMKNMPTFTPFKV